MNDDTITITLKGQDLENLIQALFAGAAALDNVNSMTDHYTKAADLLRDFAYSLPPTEEESK